ncbi:hypothetical protein [Sphingomonas crocodyli]|uniref:Lipoprotein n=1 Tax=Sphingomonas crocodyli TaxID=1979270 RepID=A0A437M4U5_9SPHN|nr:hypothetical protein [Sphingomonas crocodyli]RVT92699.1 hypothetical protein EOD43_01895 [Sphingomonas crocodyli]
MRAKLILIALPALALAGCEVKVGDKAKDESGNVVVSTESGVSIDAPGFKAKVDIPGIDISSADMDIDGMKLFPGSKVANVNVVGKSGPGDTVTMGYTAPGAPAAVATYYQNAAKEAGFTGVTLDGTTVNAIKDDGDKVTITAAADGANTKGQILIVEQKD